MTRLSLIFRWLLLLLLLGCGPATAECCCGTGQSVCDMEMAPSGAEKKAWTTVWKAVDEAVAARALLTTERLSSCAVEPASVDCPCWKPRQPESRVAPSLPAQTSQMVALVPRLLALPRPRVKIQASTILAPPPLPPPIERVGWDYSLFPLPPPFRV